MDTRALRDFANEQLKKHGLYRQGWRFRYDQAKTRFGCCRYTDKLITLSRYLVERNDPSECEDTVLHEIAHALAGKGAGHGPRWQQACRLTGAKPERCYDKESVNLPEPVYWLVCPNCNDRQPAYRMPRSVSACRKCCRKYSGGRFDERFRFRVVEASTGRDLTQHASPATRMPRYIGACPSCGKKYHFYRKQNFNKACGACCKQYSGGAFDPRFRLVMFEVVQKR
jgi:ribosomal protein L37AE/L43A